MAVNISLDPSWALGLMADAQNRRHEYNFRANENQAERGLRRSMHDQTLAHERYTFDKELELRRDDLNRLTELTNAQIDKLAHEANLNDAQAANFHASAEAIRTKTKLALGDDALAAAVDAGRLYNTRAELLRAKGLSDSAIVAELAPLREQLLKTVPGGVPDDVRNNPTLAHSAVVLLGLTPENALFSADVSARQGEMLGEGDTFEKQRARMRGTLGQTLDLVRSPDALAAFTREGGGASPDQEGVPLIFPQQTRQFLGNGQQTRQNIVDRHASMGLAQQAAGEGQPMGMAGLAAAQQLASGRPLNATELAALQESEQKGLKLGTPAGRREAELARIRHKGDVARAKTETGDAEAGYDPDSVAKYSDAAAENVARSIWGPQTQNPRSGLLSQLSDDYYESIITPSSTFDDVRSQISSASRAAYDQHKPELQQTFAELGLTNPRDQINFVTEAYALSQKNTMDDVLPFRDVNTPGLLTPEGIAEAKQRRLATGAGRAAPVIPRTGLGLRGWRN